MHALLVQPPRLCLWRAVTDNDMSFSLHPRFVRSGFFSLWLENVDTQTNLDSTTVTFQYRSAFGDPVVHKRILGATADGDLTFREEVTLPPGTRDGLRVGVEFTLGEGFENVSWVGLGPWENYPDRNSSALLGRWNSTIDDFVVPYVRPQENGTRGGVTSLEITGPAGSARIDAPRPMHMSVGRHTVDQLESARHWWELPGSTSTTVHLDIAHRGIGTALLGPDTLPLHRLATEQYSWDWKLQLTGPERRTTSLS